MTELTTYVCMTQYNYPMKNNTRNLDVHNDIAITYDKEYYSIFDV